MPFIRASHSHFVIYVLAYPVFDPETAERLHAFRVRHEPDRAKLVAPHITLVFGVADAHLGALSDLLDTVSAQAQPVQVIFDRYVIEFDPFEGKHKLFLLCGAGSQRITALHTGLYDGDHRSELS
ncbi:MAG: 2'-5' RNA ligase family protein, partial [Pseudomonadota bacterium]